VRRLQLSMKTSGMLLTKLRRSVCCSYRPLFIQSCETRRAVAAARTVPVDNGKPPGLLLPSSLRIETGNSIAQGVHGPAVRSARNGERCDPGDSSPILTDRRRPAQLPEHVQPLNQEDCCGSASEGCH